MIENESLKLISELLQSTVIEGVITEDDCLKEITDIINQQNKPKRKRSNAWECLRTMPPLFHKLPNANFDIEKSEVLEWISNQKPAILWLMQSAHKNGYISYCKDTGKWKGCKEIEPND